MGLILDTSLTFDEYIKAITPKVSKFISLLRKLNNRLPWSSFTTIYKSFVRPDRDDGDVIVDKTYNNSSSIETWGGGVAGLKPLNKQPKFLRLLILVHLRSYFIETLNKFLMGFDIMG